MGEKKALSEMWTDNVEIVGKGLKMDVTAISVFKREKLGFCHEQLSIT